MADVTVKRLEDFEAIFGGGMRRVRAGLGVTLLRPAGDRAAAELHDVPRARPPARRAGRGLYGAQRQRVADGRRGVIRARARASSPGSGRSEAQARSPATKGARLLCLGGAPGPGLRAARVRPRRAVPLPEAQKERRPDLASGTGPRSRGRAARPRPAVVGDHVVGRGRGRSQPGTPLSFSRTRSAAAATSSAIAIEVAASSRALRVAAARASRRAGAARRSRSPPRPGPIRQARPKLSAMITAGRAPAASRISARIRRAEASASSGSSETESSLGRLELSMPALAQTQPSPVSVISTPRSARTTSLLSSRISSTSAGSLPSTAASFAAPRRRGSTADSLRTRPSALETTFWEMTTTSPSASSASGRRSARRAGPPRSISGRPADRGATAAAPGRRVKSPAPSAVRFARPRLGLELASPGR